MLSIPTKIINLEKRGDRRSYIEREFSGRSEFDVQIVRAIVDDIPSRGLYSTVMEVIQKAKKDQLPFVLICEDDHQFTVNYDRHDFLSSIRYLNEEGADMFLGGLSWFDFFTEKKNSYYRIHSFTGTQFMIIYARFYEVLLRAKFPDYNTIDRWRNYRIASMCLCLCCPFRKTLDILMRQARTMRWGVCINYSRIL